MLLFGFSLAVLPVANAQVPVANAESSRDTTRVVALGEVEVLGSRVTVAQRIAQRLTQVQLQSTGSRDLSEALPLVPGIVLQRVGPRNEAGLRLRGFDLRHVPIYVDGVPLYVPYDGFVDLARFVTADVGRIVVSKGFSSLLYGPNALAGTVNLITTTPTRPIEGSFQLGWRSQGGREASVSLGTRRAHWFAVADIAYVAQASFAVSGAFSPVPNENGGRRNNASRDDTEISAKVGITPTEHAMYAVAYHKQDGSKGNPPYAGPVGDIQARFWQWPQWNKKSVYLLADQAISEAIRVRGRVYYDQYANALFSYDDATYSSQTKPSSFQSYSDDDSYGGSLQFNTTALVGQTIGIAAHLKHDRHRERDQVQAVGRYEDVTWSASVEDEVMVGTGTSVVAGLMYSRRRAQSARMADVDEDFPLSEKGMWEGQLAVVHAVSEAGDLFANVGLRTRFPTIKDRYSYRQGRALPNPSLLPERALNLGVGFDGALLPSISLRTELFFSRIDDVIQTGQVTNPTTGRALAQLQNAGRARHVGGEARVRVQIARWLLMDGSYAYVHLRNLADSDVPFTHTPSHTQRLYLESAVHGNLVLCGWLTHTSSRFSRIEGTTLTRLDSFTTVDLELLYRLNRGIQFHAGVRNVFDANYELVAGYPEAGRNLFIRLSAAF